MLANDKSHIAPVLSDSMHVQAVGTDVVSKAGAMSTIASMLLISSMAQ